MLSHVYSRKSICAMGAHWCGRGYIECYVIFNDKQNMLFAVLIGHFMRRASGITVCETNFAILI